MKKNTKCLLFVSHTFLSVSIKNEMRCVACGIRSVAISFVSFDLEKKSMTNLKHILSSRIMFFGT